MQVNESNFYQVLNRLKPQESKESFTGQLASIVLMLCRVVDAIDAKLFAKIDCSNKQDILEATYAENFAGTVHEAFADTLLTILQISKNFRIPVYSFCVKDWAAIAKFNAIASTHEHLVYCMRMLNDVNVIHDEGKHVILCKQLGYIDAWMQDLGVNAWPIVLYKTTPKHNKFFRTETLLSIMLGITNKFYRTGQQMHYDDFRFREGSREPIAKQASINSYKAMLVSAGVLKRVDRGVYEVLKLVDVNTTLDELRDKARTEVAKDAGPVKVRSKRHSSGDKLVNHFANALNMFYTEGRAFTKQELVDACELKEFENRNVLNNYICIARQNGMLSKNDKTGDFIVLKEVEDTMQVSRKLDEQGNPIQKHAPKTNRKNIARRSGRKSRNQ